MCSSGTQSQSLRTILAYDGAPSVDCDDLEGGGPILTPALRDTAASFASMMSSEFRSAHVDGVSGRAQLIEEAREMERGADGSYRDTALRIDGTRRGKSGSRSAAIGGSIIGGGGFGVLPRGGASITDRGGEETLFVGEVTWPCCSALTAAPFHTVPLGRTFALSTCIGSALVPFLKSGGKSVVLGGGMLASAA